jgi:hypothetical protein
MFEELKLIKKTIEEKFPFLQCIIVQQKEIHGNSKDISNTFEKPNPIDNE